MRSPTSPGVTVGHVTVWRDEPEPPAGRGIARTGVTAVLPAPIETIFGSPVPAGTAVLNGSGELTSSLVIREWGMIETPIYLTSTHAVGRVYDGAIEVAIASDPLVGTEEFVIPVVGECDDSWLSEGRLVQVEAADVGRAVAAAAGGAGSRGRGRRRNRDDDEGLQGRDRDGEPDRSVDRWQPSASSSSRTSTRRRASSWTAFRSATSSASLPLRRRSKAGSCIAVVAVDAPLASHQLERVARRAGLGLARCGSVGHHGSGEIFVAFAPPGRRPRGDAPAATVPDRDLNDVFEAAVDATEEAVLNALWAAPEVVGREGRVGRALPHDDVLGLLDAHGRLHR